jgi:hypothetical protein
MPKRKLLTLSDEAAEILPKLAGYHDQGTYVSQLIMEAAKQTDPEEVGELEEADIATLRRMVQRLMRDVAGLKDEVAGLKETRPKQ